MKALIKPKIRTVYILILTGLIVMMSIHTNNSLESAELQIMQRLDQAGLSHANINITNDSLDQEDYQELYELLDTYKNKGVSYDVDTYYYADQAMVWSFLLAPNEVSLNTTGQHYGLMYYVDLQEDQLLQFEIMDGKSYEDLLTNEIILPYSYYESGEYQLGDEFSFETVIIIDSVYFKGEDPEFTQVKCVVTNAPECNDYARYEGINEYSLTVVGFAKQAFYNDYVTESDFNTNIDFFKPDRPLNHNYALITKETKEAINQSNVVDLSMVQNFGQELIEARPYYSDYLQMELNDIFSDGNQDALTIKSKDSDIRVNIYYSRFSKEVENQLAKDINNMNLGLTHLGSVKRFRLDTLTSKMDKEPMVTSVLQVLSTYVLMGVLISSFYSFYIHLRNQIRTSAKEITALLMQGVTWNKIFGVYLLELGLIGIIALGCYTIIAVITGQLGVSETLYASKLTLHLKTVLYSCMYFLSLALVLLISILPFRKDVLQKFRKGAQTRLNGLGLTQAGLIRRMSIKRVTKYISSSIGFAFSISLVITIIMLSMASSYHLRNLYSEETFGIRFDYMISFNDPESSSQVFEATKEFSEVQAQIKKNEEILFTEHDLWEGNSKFYKSSEIVFYNEIKDFVPLYSGTYPPHWTEIKGDPPKYNQTGLASRRHLDRRDLSRNNSSVESRYLFYFEDETSLYERAYEILGKVNALYNNGWALSAYQPFYDGPFEPTEIFTNQYVLILKDEVSESEFEEFLEGWDVTYLKYETLLSEFQTMNNQMNATSLLISMTVSILMTILLIINIGGLVVNVRFEIKDDDILLSKLGISQTITNRVNWAVLILRILASIGFLAMLIIFIYPRYFNDLLGAFGLFSMPGSIMKPFIGIVSSFTTFLILLFMGITKRSQ